MAENPLLPNAELRALHGMLQRAFAVSAEGSQTPRPKHDLADEAILAGTLLQVRAGDLIVHQGEDPRPKALLTPTARTKSQVSALVQTVPQGAPALLLATGQAAALQRVQGEGIVLALAETSTSSQAGQPFWLDALGWAQEDRLPLVVAVADPAGAAIFQNTGPADPEQFSWATAHKAAARLQLPILSVDGEDAVAVYRVMQESVLRARSRSGPAILWAALPEQPARRKRKRQEAPPALQRLERYLGARNIAFA